ncbi:MAG TPA: hypothetical protein VNG13_01375 [Mycobacteriales bacterium]|nr:hypothetical protein [Mycobacteriales bacterium]
MDDWICLYCAARIPTGERPRHTRWHQVHDLHAADCSETQSGPDGSTGCSCGLALWTG